MSWSGANRWTLLCGWLSPSVSVFMVSYVNQLLATALDFGRDPLISTLARKQISIFPTMSKYSFNVLPNSRRGNNTQEALMPCVWLTIDFPILLCMCIFVLLSHLLFLFSSFYLNTFPVSHVLQLPDYHQITAIYNRQLMSKDLQVSLMGCRINFLTLLLLFSSTILF